MTASPNPEQSFIRNGNGRMVRILAGASVFSGLTVGLGLTATHLLDPGTRASSAPQLAVRAMVPSGENKIDMASAAGFRPVPALAKAARVEPRVEPKTARVVGRPAAGAGRGTLPLSADAFDRRFVAPVSASALPQPQRLASHLLAVPQPSDVRSAFSARLADAAGAMAEARAFRGARPEALAGATLVALARPDELPRILDVGPTPAPDRAVPKAEEKQAPAKSAKPDPRSAGKLRETPDEVGADKQNKQALRPGRSAKAPAVVASLQARPDAPAKPKSLWQALGFARPDNPEEGRAGRNIPWPGGSRKVAYYDISAQKVYMPNGETMEAHSGQGKLRDNPAYVHVKMRGSTPPSTYRLSRREALFHGVEALRMTPVDGVNPHGRVGLLTHSYLRRVPGDSAGCVVFKDYPRFLRAWKRGEVDHIVVVPNMNKGRVLTAKVASMFSRAK